MVNEVTSSGEVRIGNYAVGIQFICRTKGIDVLPIIFVNWNNGKCLFGFQIGWLNFNGSPYIRAINKERREAPRFTWSVLPEIYFTKSWDKKPVLGI